MEATVFSHVVWKWLTRCELAAEPSTRVGGCHCFPSRHTQGKQGGKGTWEDANIHRTQLSSWSDSVDREAEEVEEQESPRRRSVGERPGAAEGRCCAERGEGCRSSISRNGNTGQGSGCSWNTTPGFFEEAWTSASSGDLFLQPSPQVQKLP